MKKVIQMLAIVVALSVNVVSAQNSDSTKSKIPTIDVCRPMPENFWSTAGVQELFDMISHNDHQKDRAYAEIWKKISYFCKHNYSDRKQIETFTRNIGTLRTSPFWYEYQKSIIALFKGGDMFLENGFSNIVFPTLDSPEIINDVTKFISKNLAEGLERNNSMWNEIGRVVVNNSIFSDYRKEAVATIRKSSQTENLVQFFSVSEKNSPEADSLWSEIMTRAISGDIVPSIMVANPAKALDVWNKVYKQGLCLSEDVLLQIIVSINDKDVVKYPTYREIQEVAFTMLVGKEYDLLAIEKYAQRITSYNFSSENYFPKKIGKVIENIPNQKILDLGLVSILKMIRNPYCTPYIKNRVGNYLADNDSLMKLLTLGECLEVASNTNTNYFTTCDSTTIKLYHKCVNKVAEITNPVTTAEKFLESYTTRSFVGYVIASGKDGFQNLSFDKKAKRIQKYTEKVYWMKNKNKEKYLKETFKI